MLGATDSTRKPRASSSLTRCVTIARESPVRSMSSERECARPRRTNSRMATMASSDSSGMGRCFGTFTAYFCVSSAKDCRQSNKVIDDYRTLSTGIPIYYQYDGIVVA